MLCNRIEYLSGNYGESICCEDLTFIMNSFHQITKYACLLFTLALMADCCPPKPVNTIGHPSFDAEGRSLDSLSHLQSTAPSSIKFFVEASGSMNGFFRSNRATHFKRDIWSVFSNFESIVENVYVFERQKQVPKAYNINSFRNSMNTGKFISSASTMVPEMFHTVLSSVDINKGETAILVSDMKYSPVGQKASEALMIEYSSDIRNAVMKTDAAICLLAATSNYLDRKGNDACVESPYYYVIIGNSENVVWLRNAIATVLSHENTYVDAIDCGVNYQSPAFTLNGIINGFQLDDQPTITDYDKSYDDTCRFNLNIDLTAYPWALAEHRLLKDSLVITSERGASVEIDTIVYKVDNHTDQMLKRKAMAQVKLKYYDLFDDSDVLEWHISVPECTFNQQFAAFLEASSEDELDKTYSLENFLQGMFRGKSNKCSAQPGRILISTVKQ